MKSIVLAFIVLSILGLSTFSQSLGTAGTISGVVTDPNGAVVPGARVTLSNSLTGYTRTVTTDASGSYKFVGVAQNNYVISVDAAGFQKASIDANVRSTIPIDLPIKLSLAGTAATVDVMTEGNLIENVPTTHVNVDQSVIGRLPLTTPGNGLSDAVTMTSPGVVADSNGFFHPLGDHAQTQISLDNQPITDQQSKAFSTQVPVNAIQSLEVITGATPAEYGDKTSLVINATTRSGLNQKKPSGSFTTTYGTFGTLQQEASLAYGGPRFGNFTAFNYERSNRFLDAPEFVPLHDTGNSFSIFDRLDYAPNQKDTFHANIFVARNKFQIANTYGQQALGQDQRQQVQSLNLAPGWVHIFNSSTVLSINPFYRHDDVKYFPSANPFADQTTTISQHRTLSNYGLRGDVSYASGIHNMKFGGQATWTGLSEQFGFGITDPNFNDPASPDFIPGLLPFDLTRGGTLFNFSEQKTISQQAAYAQDTISLRNGLTASLGVRFDNYHGISQGHSIQPRFGLSYHIKSTNTVLRASYTRNFETPYNENLILSNITGGNGLADGILGSATTGTLKPGNRNQYNFGVQQGIGSHIVADFDYFIKRTNNAYDFNVLLNTPITFPISWSQSRIHGYSVRFDYTNWKGLSAFFRAGHTVAEYFPPETGGLFFNSDLPAGPFLIDHDQKFQFTTEVQYGFDTFTSFHKFAPMLGFTWRYDSGLVAGSVSDYATALALSADEQQQIGLFCGNVFATLSMPLTTCNSDVRGALRIKIPADGTE
ncbi:MAG: TonB-dependent receptor, partial [Acidobacteria bacterium]|nr:TonB-dependent receptor [Acidobacteriota bacterium]